MRNKKEKFSSIGEAQLFLQEAPQLLEKAMKGKKLANVHMFLVILAIGAAVAGAVFTETLPQGSTEWQLMRTLSISFPSIVLNMLILFSILIYHIGGGFGNILSTFKKVAVWGWFIIPIFPIDLVVGLAIVLEGIVLMLYFPRIFMAIHIRSLRKNMAAAEEYINRQMQINALNAQAAMNTQGFM